MLLERRLCLSFCFVEASKIKPHTIICLINMFSFSQDEISNEALKCLYGTSRASEIEDAVFNVSKKDTATVNIDEDSSKKDKDRATESQELKVPKFTEVVNYVWDQMQKRKKGSNAKHRFVVGNQVLQFHPMTYQEVSHLIEYSFF